MRFHSIGGGAEDDKERTRSMVHGKKRIPYWIDRRLNGLAGPEYDATILFGLPSEPEDSQYWKCRIRHGTRALALLVFLYFLSAFVQCVLPKSLIELLVYVLKHRPQGSSPRDTRSSAVDMAYLNQESASILACQCSMRSSYRDLTERHSDFGALEAAQLIRNASIGRG